MLNVMFSARHASNHAMFNVMQSNAVRDYMPTRELRSSDLRLYAHNTDENYNSASCLQLR